MTRWSKTSHSGSKLSPAARKQKRRRIAANHISKMIDLALKETGSEPDLARRHAQIAWSISTRFNVRLKEKRRMFCRFCKDFIVPPRTARFRLSKKRKALNITCLNCGRTYHVMLSRRDLQSAMRTING